MKAEHLADLGLTPEQFAAALGEQEGRCGLCRAELSSAEDTAVIYDQGAAGVELAVDRVVCLVCGAFLAQVSGQDRDARLELLAGLLECLVGSGWSEYAGGLAALAEKFRAEVEGQWGEFHREVGEGEVAELSEAEPYFREARDELLWGVGNLTQVKELLIGAERWL